MCLSPSRVRAPLRVACGTGDPRPLLFLFLSLPVAATASELATKSARRKRAKGRTHERSTASQGRQVVTTTDRVRDERGVGGPAMGDVPRINGTAATCPIAGLRPPHRHTHTQRQAPTLTYACAPARSSEHCHANTKHTHTQTHTSRGSQQRDAPDVGHVDCPSLLALSLTRPRVVRPPLPRRCGTGVRRRAAWPHASRPSPSATREKQKQQDDAQHEERQRGGGRRGGAGRVEGRVTRLPIEEGGAHLVRTPRPRGQHAGCSRASPRRQTREATSKLERGSEGRGGGCLT